MSQTSERRTAKALLAAGLFSLIAGCGGSDSSSTSPASAAGAGQTATTTAAATTAAATTAGTGTANTALASAPVSALGKETVAPLNAIRATARDCGGVSFAAAAPVAANAKIEAAAAMHSQYMQTIDALTHTGSGNSNAGDRVTGAGYVWSRVGENIAFAYVSLDEVLQGWVESPGHCANLMNPAFTEFGIAQSGSGDKIYWTLDLAAPRN